MAPAADQAEVDRRAIVVIVAVVLAVAAVGGWSAAPEQRWYRELEKPGWQPPEAAFGPVWTVLYALAATSAIAAWQATPAHSRERRALVGLYAANAILNAAWTGLFFRGKRLRTAAADSALLFGNTLTLIACTRRRSRTASVALVPYAAWTGFATALSAEIARRNG